MKRYKIRKESFSRVEGVRSVRVTDVTDRDGQHCNSGSSLFRMQVFSRHPFRLSLRFVLFACLSACRSRSRPAPFRLPRLRFGFLSDLPLSQWLFSALSLMPVYWRRCEPDSEAVVRLASAYAYYESSSPFLPFLPPTFPLPTAQRNPLLNSPRSPKGLSKGT